MSIQKSTSPDVPAPRVQARDSQGSPVTILAIALASGIGYFSWKLWKKRRIERNGDKDGSRTTVLREETASRSKSNGSPFSFDRQPKSATSTSGRQDLATSSSGPRKPSRQDPKPKSQKQLRKEAKQAKKASREQAARDAENAAVAAAIEKRAKDLGMGKQPPEPQNQYYVDYDGVTKAYDKIVEWQQTGKKKY